MSHSTTTTATYVLAKYSRSYPKSAQDTNSEWQHYTKPTLKLILDVKKSLTSGELESVFLRIIWSMEDSYARDQSELTFENFDLLSFSSLTARQTDRSQGGLPLKAVYRDSVVGIRYISVSNGTFRRFQITFSSPTDASQFIDSISSVCPCKPNSTPGAPANIPQMMHVPSMVPPNLQHPIAKPSIMNTSAHAAHTSAVPLSNMHHNVSLNQADLFSPVASTQRFSSYPTMHFQHPGAPYVAPGMPMSSSSQMLIDHRNQLPSSSPPLPPPSAQPTFQFNTSQTHSQSTSYTPTPTQSENPFYSQTSTSSVKQHAAFNQVSVNEPLEADARRSEAESSEIGIQTTDQFVFALREATSLYDMPHHSLEKLVGDVVQEDGFMQLMESLSLMWKIRGYING
ncbi:hypothetical protein F5890DRAFT_1474337 [Lentinula detonsa]|uniref:Proteophosphoglycan 5 n=1 Tax=Lentinula detonsa TaxID=2804962 RepID=A0AA38PZS5_9AGAR|nr:hypothetical protein F5890DRAFT_1474337 [Lentinula detonsa]